MDHTLAYLRETLSNYTDTHTDGKKIYQKLINSHYRTEEAFVRALSSKEIEFLNKILPDEIKYAQEEQDEKRSHELNEVYELLI